MKAEVYQFQYFQSFVTFNYIWNMTTKEDKDMEFKNCNTEAAVRYQRFTFGIGMYIKNSLQYTVSLFLQRSTKYAEWELINHVYR